FNDLITGNGGSVDKVEEWGKRRLAYAIDYKTEGYYVLVNFQAEAELPKELERNLQISDSVIRYQVIKQIERKVGIKPRAVRPAPVAPAAEAPAAEEPVETPAAE
ncbi:MAG: 30S ribosomal protein S6, partial [Clostridia bacterium]|nr:30S ribosomal protein S6 [Clostridia bacterium]